MATRRNENGAEWIDNGAEWGRLGMGQNGNGGHLLVGNEVQLVMCHWSLGAQQRLNSMRRRCRRTAAVTPEMYSCTSHVCLSNGYLHSRAPHLHIPHPHCNTPSYSYCLSIHFSPTY